MKPELVQAAATLAAVALQKCVQANEDITEAHMKSALLSAYQAIQDAEHEWRSRNPPAGVFV
ncbi:hypothetical protein QYQ99_27225 [Comamonas testosteroni]|uniref:hypothetical protein n=1 Tax=Comamonas testosteroni TaxID=285 RepID=UPI00265F737E|nr:hypothetical protein [Comamonas testosteroni]WKL15957.1 hypothetical protein QYQ99_27225 [Comamonas testosteroni]